MGQSDTKTLVEARPLWPVDGKRRLQKVIDTGITVLMTGPRIQTFAGKPAGVASSFTERTACVISYSEL